MTDLPAEPTARTGPPPPPVRYAGRYQVARELARGGMGTVYAAHDTLLDRTVALKVLRPEPGRAVQDEFLREARAAAALKHPGIADVYDAGIEGDAPYIVMEYIAGETLRESLARRGPLPAQQAAALAAQVARALDYAHRQGVIHCDVKPGNILLSAGNVPKLVDFGIARVEREPEDQDAAGTAGYVAPEQLAGEAVDGRADVYGLGAVLYEMLTGERPQPTGDLAAVSAQSMTPPTPAHEVNAVVPRTLSGITTRCLAPERQARLPSAGALAAALETFLEELQEAPTRSRPPAAAPRPLGRQEAGRSHPSPSGNSQRRSPWPALAAIGVLAVIAAAGGAWLTLRLLDSGEQPVVVPEVAGSRVDRAAAQLQQAGLTVADPVERVASDRPLGTVLQQQPAAGNHLARFAPVHLTISAGP